MAHITPRISAKDALAILSKSTRSSCKAKKTFCFSKHFHGSKSEAGYCDWLLARLQHREIFGFQWQVSLKLPIVKGMERLPRCWKVDFGVIELDGTKSYHESKGWNRSDDSYRLRRDAFLYANPSAVLYVNKERWTGGRVKKKSLKWRASDIKRVQKKAKTWALARKAAQLKYGTPGKALR